jgi:hypothetical protein
MTRNQTKELASMMRRVDLLRITPAERVAALAALRNGFIIVDRMMWLGHKVAQLRAFFSGKRALRPDYRHS